LHLSEKEDTTITTNTMFPLPKKERLEEQDCQPKSRIANPRPSKKANPDGAKQSQDTAQNSSNEEILEAALELEKSRRLKKAQELRRKEAEERKEKSRGGNHL
jgi:hypothetical protein